MAKLLKLRRGTTTQHGSFTGAEGEVTVDTDKETLVVHDGSTAGGHPVAAEDLANVSSSTIAGRLSNDSIATSKIAGGTLPSDVTVASANLVDGTIVNADVNASAAIAGTKISPNFGSQNITTTGTLTMAGSLPTIILNDENNENDFNIQNINGTFAVGDIDAGAARLEIASNGTTTVRKNLDALEGVDVTGNITVSGTVDGRDVASDGSKLDGIESGATADQSNAEIRAAVEAASDSNVITDADHSKLNGIEASATADQSASEILTAIKTVDGSGSGLDADLLDGANASDSAGNSTIVKRTGSGYIFANYFNTTANDVSSGVTKVMVETGNDNYIRHGDAGSIRSFINVENGATADQTGAEIASALNGQSIYTTGYIGRDSTDNISFSNNAHMDVKINNSTEFRFEADGDFHADGDVIAQSTTISSDIRLKENIEPISDALKKVEALNGVSFDWKKTGERSAGVIAQEVIGVLPEAVKEVTPVAGGDSHLAVNYHALTSILIEAIKELQAEVEKLKGGE